MAKLDLYRDYTINGHTFAAGKAVDTMVVENNEDGTSKKVDYADGIKELIKQAEEADKLNEPVINDDKKDKKDK